MRGKRKIEDRNSTDKKFALVDSGVDPDLHIHLARIELPFWMREFASRDGAVVHHIMVRTALLHYLAPEGKRIRGGEKKPRAAHAHPRSAFHIFEAADFGQEVVC